MIRRTTTSALPHAKVMLWLVTGVLLVNLFVCALAGLSLDQSRNQYREQAEVTTRNLTQILAFALDGAKRMDAMIVSLLDYSRVGRKTELKQWLESRQPLDEALGFLAPMIEDAQALIQVDGEWPRIVASRDEMSRLFQNLIGNALKYREPDQPARIAVAASAVSGTWRVSVSDHGIGIDPQQIGRLFQFFSRLQSRAHYEGTGMGLALCRRIIEHHGGRIWAESSGPGQGSSFVFELPLQPAAVAIVAAAEQRAQETQHAG